MVTGGRGLLNEKKKLNSTKALASKWSQSLEDETHVEENEAQWINNLTWEDHSAADNNG